MQHSESPSPRQAGHARNSIGHAYTVCESPVSLVSPCKDLIAQTGAMLIDSHSMRFASPCYGVQSASTDHLQELAMQRPPSRQQSSVQAQHADAGIVRDAAQTSDMCQQTQHAPSESHANQPHTVRNSNDQTWRTDALIACLSHSLLALRRLHGGTPHLCQCIRPCKAGSKARHTLPCTCYQ